MKEPAIIEIKYVYNEVKLLCKIVLIDFITTANLELQVFKTVRLSKA